MDKCTNISNAEKVVSAPAPGPESKILIEEIYTPSQSDFYSDNSYWKASDDTIHRVQKIDETHKVHGVEYKIKLSNPSQDFIFGDLLIQSAASSCSNFMFSRDCHKDRFEVEVRPIFIPPGESEKAKGFLPLTSSVSDGIFGKRDLKIDSYTRVHNVQNVDTGVQEPIIEALKIAPSDSKAFYTLYKNIISSSASNGVLIANRMRMLFEIYGGMYQCFKDVKAVVVLGKDYDPDFSNKYSVTFNNNRPESMSVVWKSRDNSFQYTIVPPGKHQSEGHVSPAGIEPGIEVLSVFPSPSGNTISSREIEKEIYKLCNALGEKFDKNGKCMINKVAPGISDGRITVRTGSQDKGLDDLRIEKVYKVEVIEDDPIIIRIENGEFPGILYYMQTLEEYYAYVAIPSINRLDWKEKK
jgi:hypothetical protein